MTIKFKNNLESSFLTSDITLPIYSKPVSYISVNPYFHPYADAIDISFSYLDFFSRTVNNIKPYYVASTKNEELISESATVINGINTSLCLLKYVSIDQQDVKKTEVYKRLAFIREPSNAQTKDLVVSGFESSSNLDALMISTNFQFAILNFLLMLKESITPTNNKDITLNDRIMFIVMMYSLCPSFTEHSGTDLFGFEWLDDLLGTNYSTPGPKQDVYVQREQNGTAVGYYNASYIKNIAFKNQLLDNLSSISERIYQDDGSNLLQFSSLINPIDGSLKTGLSDAYRDKLIKASHGWLLDRFNKASRTTQRFSQGSILEHINSNVFKQLISNDTYKIIKQGINTTSASTNLKMLLDLSFSAIANTPGNLFAFDNNSINDVPVYIQALNLDKKTGPQFFNISDFNQPELIQSINNDFSRCLVLLNNTIDNLIEVMKNSNIFEIREVKNKDELLYPQDAYLNLFSRLNQSQMVQKRYEILVMNEPFLRIEQGLTISPIAIRSHGVDNVRQNRDKELINQVDYTMIKAKITLDNLFSNKRNGESDLVVFSRQLDQILVYFEDLDYHYAKMKTVAGSYAIGHNGITMFLGLVKISKKLQTLPIIGRYVNDVDLNQLLEQLLKTSDDLSACVEVCSGNKNYYMDIIRTINSGNKLSNKDKEHLLYESGLIDNLSLNISIIAKASLCIKKINEMIAETPNIKDESSKINNKNYEAPNGAQSLKAWFQVVRVIQLVTTASRAFYVLVFAISAMLIFKEMIKNIFYSGFNFALAGALNNQKQTEEDLEKAINQLVSNPNLDPDQRKVLLQQINDLRELLKKQTKTVDTGLEIQMKKPSIFDTPGLLARNASYVAVGLFALWGVTKIYYMSKESKKRLESSFPDNK